ncbi:hypothetical protein METH_06015 [Leisingera methylohalidivorans DSM 14336]|uniref:Uncharacterized protein n=1 Tax=Leisingera methylohalidivorans DSM 14336 TaxID=999552 RepID=V9VU09_9RHOB|nr:hypothetical protein METH_06015 [Leisingera methylohalidivorans DSM 14336]
MSLAIGYSSDGDWVSEGWWNIPAGACRTPVGGDLKIRYYYYRANASGAAFASGDYTFCTSPEPFTIHGDSQCGPRGYETQGFRKLDTGETATHFTLTLNAAADPPAAQAPVAQDPAPAQGITPGTYGEPYADDATLQGCSSDGPRECSFHAGGTKFLVRDDGRTPQFVFSVMETLDTGTPIVVEGDLEAIYDRTADVVLRDVSVRPWSEHDGLLNKLQGHWYSVDDPNAQFTVLGAERDNSYDGAYAGRDYLAVSEWCGGFEGSGPYLYAREEETGEDYCYVIDHVDHLELTLMYLPRGSILRYRKLE